MTQRGLLAAFRNELALWKYRARRATLKSSRKRTRINLSARDKVLLAALILAGAMFFVLGYWATANYAKHHPHYREIGPDF